MMDRNCYTEKRSYWDSNNEINETVTSMPWLLNAYLKSTNRFDIIVKISCFVILKLLLFFVLQQHEETYLLFTGGARYYKGKKNNTSHLKSMIIYTTRETFLILCFMFIFFITSLIHSQWPMSLLYNLPSSMLLAFSPRNNVKSLRLRTGIY